MHQARRQLIGSERKPVRLFTRFFGGASVGKYPLLRFQWMLDEATANGLQIVPATIRRPGTFAPGAIVIKVAIEVDFEIELAATTCSRVCIRATD